MKRFTAVGHGNYCAGFGGFFFHAKRKPRNIRVLLRRFVTVTLCIYIREICGRRIFLDQIFRRLVVSFEWCIKRGLCEFSWFFVC